MNRSRGIATLAVAVLALTSCVVPAGAQVIGYGVNASGSLFRFNVDDLAPAPITTIGTISVGANTFVPEGIDFRPSTNTLYAIDIGANTTQLYTINTTTAVATAVGTGFPSSGGIPNDYNLTGAQTFGFDFNPKTLQLDGSIRIRLVSSNGQNLRLNSDTGQIAAVDGAIAYIPAIATSVDGAAYINNIAATSGTTALYDLDFRNNVLALQNPPNNGTVTQVGSFGATISTLGAASFDIFTNPADVDPTIAGDRGLAVIRRADTSAGAYLLYEVNLGTGAITNGRLVGSAAGADFTGGFAVVPEPCSLVLGALGALGLGLLGRRRIAKGSR